MVTNNGYIYNMKHHIETFESYDYKQHLKNLSQGKVGPIPQKRMADAEVNWSTIERSEAIQRIRSLGFTVTILKGMGYPSFGTEIIRTSIKQEKLLDLLPPIPEDLLKYTYNRMNIHYSLWSDSRTSFNYSLPGINHYLKDNQFFHRRDTMTTERVLRFLYNLSKDIEIIIAKASTLTIPELERRKVKFEEEMDQSLDNDIEGLWVI